MVIPIPKRIYVYFNGSPGFRVSWQTITKLTSLRVHSLSEDTAIHVVYVESDDIKILQKGLKDLIRDLNRELRKLKAEPDSFCVHLEVQG